MTVEVGIRSLRRCPNGRFAPNDCVAPSESLTRRAPFLSRASNVEQKICRTMSISGKLVRCADETAKRLARTRRQNDAGYGVRESH